MKELLKKTEELFDAVVGKKSTLDDLIKKNELSIERVEKRERDLKEKEVALQRREAKVKEVEDIVAIKEANSEEDASLKKKRVEIKTQIDAFVKYEAEAKKQLAAKASKLDSDIENFEIEKNKFRATEGEKLRKEFLREIAAIKTKK